MTSKYIMAFFTELKVLSLNNLDKNPNQNPFSFYFEKHL